jgi:hypothetical protein
MGVAPAALVEGVARTPLSYGLFSAVGPFRAGDRERWESGVQWEPLTCAPAEGIGDPACAPDATVGLPKSLDKNRAPIGDATAFTIYGHDICNPVGGNNIVQAQGRATAHLVAREEARVEQALWTGDLGNIPNLAGTGDAPDPEVLAGGTAVSPDVAFALLEDYVAGEYGSLGVIHVTRGTATQAAARRLVEVRGARLQTVIGTPVVAGAGYPGTSPAGASAGAGKAWAFASPAIFGYRSEVFTSSNRPGDLLDRSRNDLYAVAERTYLLGFDPCGVAAVLLDLSIV